jgi:hypothetical protein
MTTAAFQGQGGGLPKEEWMLASVPKTGGYHNTERTWTLVTITESNEALMKTYLTRPPRKLQSESYAGLITLSNYERFPWSRGAAR